ncbi:TetR/AcrR family transcriptional regulator [Millisia brevis]|uniref:TetR/AcrR family transcriptional regulator n=1 Tax=Millisia brevis TaxID=264148 RepID=UPI0008320980|nr:TetR/AcrR family transcriptional regulator [Millisia brevis]
MPTSRRRYNGKSADQRSRERRDALISAARLEWTSHGADGVRVRRVCARAGLNDRYFYQQFPHTDDLLVAVVEQGLAELREVMFDAAVACEGSPRDRMRAGILAYFEHLGDDPGLMRILTTDSAGRPGVTGARLESQRSIARIVLQYLNIDEGGDGTSGAMDPFAKAMYCVGGAAALVESWLADEFPRMSIGELADVATDSTLRIFGETIHAGASTTVDVAPHPGPAQP